MRLKVFVSIALTACFAAPVVVAAAAPEPIVSMPLLRDDRGPLKVRTRSEKGVALRVVFDTAAANSILFDHDGTTGVAPTLGRDHMVYFPFTDRLIDYRLIDWFTLNFGKHTFTSNNWVYGPWKQTGLFPGRVEPNYDVIAGRDVFNSFTVAVEPRKGRVKLYNSEDDLSARYRTSVDIVDLNPLIAVPVRYTREDTGETTEKLMIIDTGFPGVLLFADDEELALLGATEFTAPADTIADALIVDGSIQLGELDAREQRALIVSKGAFKADGVLGTGFLNNYRYAFDMEAKKLYLSRLRKSGRTELYQ